MTEFIDMVSNIAVLFTLRFEHFKGKNLSKIRPNCKAYYVKRYYEVVGKTATDVRFIKNEIQSKNDKDMEMGSLRFSNIEMKIGEPETGVLVDREIRGFASGQILSV